MANEVGAERKRVSGVKSSVASGDAENMRDSVEVGESDNELSDDGVKAGAEASAGNNGGANIGRLKGDEFTGTGAEVGEAGGGRGVVVDLAENEVGLCEVEGLFVGVEVRIVIEWVGVALEVKVRDFLQVYGLEQLRYVCHGTW